MVVAMRRWCETMALESAEVFYKFEELLLMVVAMVMVFQQLLLGLAWPPWWR